MNDSQMACGINLQQAITCLQNGKIIAYPTEGVYGLGCDPFNSIAVARLLAMKQRDSAKGLILIANSWSQIEKLIEPLSASQLNTVNSTWPGPTTWVFPASDQAPKWITGEHATIAIRITDHPIASLLCEQFNRPIVSTSANLSGMLPATTHLEVADNFNQLCCIVEGAVGQLSKPTVMKDVITNRVIRE